MTQDLRSKKVSASLFSPVVLLLGGCLLFTAGCGGGVVPASQGNGNPGDPDAPVTALKIQVTRDGIYKVTYDSLKSAGFNIAGARPQTLKLTCFENGQWVEIPLTVNGGEDGRLDPGDSVEFFGKTIRRGDRRFEFSETNVYWLSSESGDRKRISLKSAPVGQTTSQAASEVTSHYEEDTFYWQNMPDEDPSDGVRPDRWLWGNPLSRRLPAPNQQSLDEYSLDATFDIYNYLPSQPIELTFHLQPRTDVAGHHVQIFLNQPDHMIADETWDGIGSHTFTVTASSGSGLIDGQNVLRIENAGDNDLSQFHFDWFEVRYLDTLTADDGRILPFRGDGDPGSQTLRNFLLKDFAERPDVYDITDYPSEVWQVPVDPTLNAFQFRDQPGREYFAAGSSGKRIPSVALDETSNLKGETGADYIIITHESFYDAIQPLAAHRRDQGLSVVVAGITDVYDEFSGGIPDPLAIKEFLKYAYLNWNPKPRYVLLVGDATYDYKDHLGYGAGNFVKNYIPTSLYDYPILGEVPSDNWFVDVEEEDLDGDGLTDGLPEIAIGRIPAKFPTDVTEFVQKTLEYESGGHGGESGTPALFVAGEDYEVTSFDLVTRYFPEDPPDLVRSVNRSNYTDLQEARNALITELNADPWLVNYIGHGAVVEWGSTGEEWFRARAMNDLSGQRIPGVSSDTGSSNDSITADGHYFALIALNCLNGNFAVPDEGVADPSTGISVPASLAETFLLTGNRGAIAVWADSAYGFPSEYRVLAKQLYGFLLGQEHPIGESAREAIREAFLNPGTDSLGVAERPISRDLVYTIIFFGDPSTRLVRPPFPPPSP